MSELIEERLRRLDLELPAAHSPGGGVVGVVVHAGTARTSGQLPREDGRVAVTGRLGESVSLEEGCRAARLCVLNALAALAAEIGSLDRVERILVLTGFVACAPDFDGQPVVMDAASQLLVDVFGEAGRHARSAIGVTALPRRAAVEVELTVALWDR